MSKLEDISKNAFEIACASEAILMYLDTALDGMKALMNMGFLTPKKYTEEVNKILMYVIREEDKLISDVKDLYKDIDKHIQRTN